MTVSGQQVAAYYQWQQGVLGPLIDGYRLLLKELTDADAKVTEQRAAARRELASVYLTELSNPAFERVARLTGFKGFERRDPRAAMGQERKVLQHAVVQIEMDENFARRDQLVGPGGTLTQELESCNDTLRTLQAECDKFESLPGFTELVGIGYDTPGFSEKWWSASYWKHWAAGDRICKALGLNDFGDDVLPAYKKSAEPRDFMREEYNRISGQIDAVHALVQKRDQTQHRLANLEQIYLAEAQEYLGEHLENADAALLEQWVAGDADLQRAVQIGVRKVAGLTAKKRFINEMQMSIEKDLIGQLSRRQTNAYQKQQKFQRPKKIYAQFADSTIDPSFERKAQALEQQRLKLSKRTQALVAAENYAGFDMRNDQELWWYYFMQSPPPRLTPSLWDYYQRRPDVRPVVDPDYVDMGPSPAEAAATAYAAGDMEQGTYLS